MNFFFFYISVAIFGAAFLHVSADGPLTAGAKDLPNNGNPYLLTRRLAKSTKSSKKESKKSKSKQPEDDTEDDNEDDTKSSKDDMDDVTDDDTEDDTDDDIDRLRNENKDLRLQLELAEDRLFHFESAVGSDLLRTTGAYDMTAPATIKALQPDSPEQSCSWNAVSVVSTIATGILGFASIYLSGGALGPAIISTLSTEISVITGFASALECSDIESKAIFSKILLYETFEKIKYEADLKLFNGLQKKYETLEDKVFASIDPITIDSGYLNPLSTIVNNCDTYSEKTSVIAAQFCGKVYIITAQVQMARMANFERGSPTCQSAANDVATTINNGIDYLEKSYNYFSTSPLEEGLYRFCVGQCEPLSTFPCWRYNCNPLCRAEYKSTYSCFPGNNTVAFPKEKQLDDFFLQQESTIRSADIKFCADSCNTRELFIDPDYEKNTRSREYEEYVEARYAEQVWSQRDIWWWGTKFNGILAGAAYSYNALINFQRYGEQPVIDWSQNICKSTNPEENITPPKNETDLKLISCPTLGGYQTNCGECLRGLYNYIPPVENYDVTFDENNDGDYSTGTPLFESVRLPPTPDALKKACNLAFFEGKPEQLACILEPTSEYDPPKCVPAPQV